MENDRPKGWVKLWRTARDSWMHDRVDWWFAWTEILMTAHWQCNPARVHGHILTKGQFAWAHKDYADWGMTHPDQSRRFIKKAIDEQTICQVVKATSANCYAVYSVINWDTYQVYPDRECQEFASKLPEVRNFVPENPDDSNNLNEPRKIKNKELRTKNKEKNCDISSKKPKVATPKDPLDKDIKTVTDHIWKTYEQAYKVKPVWEQKIRVNLKRHIQRDGADFVIQVWDCYLGTDDDFLVRNRHIPSVFVSASVYTKYAAKAKQQEARYV